MSNSPTTAAKALQMRKIVRELHSKQDIVRLDADDIGEAIEYDPNRDLDISVIIQEGFAEQREAAGLADAATEDADLDAPSRTDATYKALLELRMPFRKEELRDGDDAKK